MFRTGMILVLALLATAADAQPSRFALEVAAAGSETAPPRLALGRGLDQAVFSLTKESVQ